jgi:hypothetical protein
MSKRLQLILALSVPVLTLVLLFVLRDWVQETLVTPLLYVVWLAQLFLASVPQTLFWAVFLVLLLRVAAGSLRSGRQARLARSAYRSQAQRGRVQTLARWIHSTRREYFKRQLARHLGELAVQVTQPHELLSPAEISAALRSGQMDAPPEILAYFQAGLDTYSRPVSLFSRLARIFGKQAPASPLDHELEQVVQFLENQSDQSRG